MMRSLKNQKRLLAILCSLAAVLIYAATAFSCTGLCLTGSDGTVVFGRTQEWGKFDLRPQAGVVPRGHAFKSQTPDHKPGLAWTGKHGFAGILIMDRVFNTAMNEKGLAGGMFYHQGFAEYAKYDPSQAGKCLEPGQVLAFILSSFATLQEVRDGLPKVKVVPLVDPDLGKPFPMHLMLAEPSGKSMVIEFKNGRAKFFDNPVGVIANNPTFDWHLTNLRNYGYLSPEPFKTKKWGDLEITPLAGGSGLLGLPGDFTSPSRFVRATVFAQTSRPTKGGLDTVQEFFRILDSFNLGANQAEGSDPSKAASMPASTQYTIANDTKNLVIYYHTMFNRRVRKLDLKKIDFSKKGIRGIPLDKKRAQDIEEVGAKLR
jgi:choloylglycine hydrolase